MAAVTAERPAGTTGHAFPQHFSYVVSARQAERALEIIDLSQAQFNEKSASPEDLQKAVIREVVMAKAFEILNPASEQDIRVLKLEQSDIDRIRADYKSGFRLLDVGAIRRGEGANAELVTVVFAKSTQHEDLLVPLVFAHTTKTNVGWKIKEAIDAWCKEVHGEVGEVLVAGRGAKFFHGLFKIFDRTEARVQQAAHEAKEEQERKAASERAAQEKRQFEGEWKANLCNRVNFVIETIKSISGTNSRESKRSLLSQIHLQHYDSVLEMILSDPEKSNRIAAAHALKSLAQTETCVKRENRMVKRTEGPRMSEPECWEMYSSNRISLPKKYINEALKTVIDPEVRRFLVEALDHLGKGLNDPPGPIAEFFSNLAIY